MTTGTEITIRCAGRTKGCGTKVGWVDDSDCLHMFTWDFGRPRRGTPPPRRYSNGEEFLLAPADQPGGPPSTMRFPLTTTTDQSIVLCPECSAGLRFGEILRGVRLARRRGRGAARVVPSTDGPPLSTG